MKLAEQREPRSDSVRNAASLVEAARTLYATSGVAVSMEDIARSAGVGKGTLYRHFPTREHLLGAVMQGCFERLATRAEALTDLNDAGESVRCWLEAFAREALVYRGIGLVLAEGLAADTSMIDAECVRMRAGLQVLLTQAQGDGVIRADVSARDVLIMVSAVVGAVGCESVESERYRNVVVEGLFIRA